MPIPVTKLFLAGLGAGGITFVPSKAGDFEGVAGGITAEMSLAGIADLNGDLIPDLIIAAPGQGNGNNASNQNSGLVYVELGGGAGGVTIKVGDVVDESGLAGNRGGDLAGAAVGAIADLNGDGLQEILLGAPGVDVSTGGGGGGSTLTDAGQAYVVWGAAPPQTVDLGGVAPDGFTINGAAAGDRLGQAILSIADLNADGKAEILVGAAGNDLGGADAGAAYLVFGKSGTGTVSTASLGAAGFRIRGEAAGDGAGRALGTLADLNGDGRAELLVGAEGNDAGGADAGAVYVVFGKATTSEVLLSSLGAGGFRIRGVAGEHAGSAVSGLGDVNGDGLADILVGAAVGNKAYVVYGKAGTAEVLLSDVAAGTGGFVINAEAAGDLSGMTVTAAGDLNRDGIADFVIGAPHNAEGGFNAGAAYVVWGGSQGAIDLSLVSQGIGGAKIVGTAGSLTGSAVAALADMNGDGTGELFIGSPGLVGESAHVVFAPDSWQPDPNVYGTRGADVMGAGYGGLHVIDGAANSIYALDGNDSVEAGGGDDSVDGGAGNDTLIGGAGNDLLDGGLGVDSLVGGDGDDTYVVDGLADVVVEAPGGGSDTVVAGVDYILAPELEALVLTGAAHTGTGSDGANSITGGAGNDTLLGMGGADTLLGGGGADSLDGGNGADSMAGGGGNDAFVVDDPGDVVTEAPGGGTDTIFAAIDTTLAAEVEALVLTGSAHHGTGNGGANSITGGAGADTLDGAGGADTLAGGGGDDTYLVDNAADVVVEAPGGGTDRVIASADYVLGAGVEALELTGAAHHGTGNAGANSITGGAGADTLDGAGGADTMTGGAGDDTYIIDDAGDVVVEDASGGFDTVVVNSDWTLAENIEAVVLTGGGHRLTGNAHDNALTGSSGGDTLDGAAGADTLTGGAGDDTYIIDDAGDVVVELPGGGNDTMIASIDATIAGGVETLKLSGAAQHGTGDGADNRLVGDAGADSLEGLGGNDTMDGGLGADTMAGGAGDDTYLIDDAGDVVIEEGGGGFDTVVVGSDWTLAENIEAVQLVGGGHALTGNAGSNELSGGDGNDTLDGGLGDDTELGGSGDDVLVSASGRDTLSGSSGNDRYVVKGGSAHIEDFLGHDTIDASEAEGDSYIDLSGEDHSHIEDQDCDLGVGGSTASKLDLQFLQDLTGSFSDDIAMVRGLVPQIVDAVQLVQPASRFGVSTFRDKAIGGFGGFGDWVYEQTLALSADAAALTAAYTAMVASGGADGPEAQIEALMQLALRASTVGFGLNAARFVVLFTDAPFHQAGDGAAAGITVANDGDAVLDGVPPGTGEDYPTIAQLKLALEGANIFPIFAVAGGFDATYQALVTALGRGAEVTLTADSSNVVAAITEGLSAVTQTHIEDAWGGVGNDTLRGSDEANHLVGNGGDDSLLGGLGDDTMEGGAGDDTYVVDSAGDVILEGTGGGRDTVVIGFDYALGAELENLTLTAGQRGSGNGADNGITGNDLGDTLEGLEGADTLTGGLGADSLDGGTGADSMAGGGGDDIYLVDDIGDVVTELAAGGSDTVQSSVTHSLGAEVETLILTGTRAVAGTGNALANTITGNDKANKLNGADGNDTLTGGGGGDRLLGGLGDDSLDGGIGSDSLEGAGGNDRLDGGAGSDTMVGGRGNDTYVVDAVTDVVVEAPGGGNDTVLSGVTWTLGDEVEALVLTGTGATSGTGNALANTITGNDKANGLDGGLGADTLVGGLGRDTLMGGDGADVFRFGAGGEGRDSILDFVHGTDAVEVSAAGFGGGLLAGMDLGATGHFVAGATATQAFGQFLYAVGAGTLFWDADGTGAGAKVAVALFTTLPGLTASDIHVIG